MLIKYMIKTVAFLLLLAIFTVNANSLFSDSAYRSLAGDQRSMHAGQSLTVMIYEQASAATSAGTDINKSVGVSANSAGNRERNQFGFGFDSDFSGGGTINRAGKLIASVSVTIQEVLKNGELRIGGEQLIEFNNEKQHIKLAGRVRPQDISADNTVLSTRVADAQITYIGDGLLGKRQKPGLIKTFLNWLF